MTTTTPAAATNFASIVAASGNNAKSAPVPASKPVAKKAPAAPAVSAKKEVTPAPAASTAPNGDSAAAAPRRPNPLNAAYDRQQDEFDRRIKSLRQQLDDLKNDVDGSNTGSKEVREKRASLRTQLRELNDKSKAIDEDKQKLQAELDALKGSSSKQTEQLQGQKDKLTVKSVEECDRRIREYDAMIQQGGLSLKDEKNLISEISKLNKNKRTLEDIELGRQSALAEGAAAKTRAVVVKERLDAKWAESKELRGQIGACRDGLRALDGDKEDAEKRKQQRDAEFTRLKAELDKVHEERKKAYEAFKAKKAERAAAWEKNQQRREEMKVRDELEDQLNALYKRLRAIDPTTKADAQLSECVNVGNYFQELIAHVSASGEHKPVATSTHAHAPNARKPDAPNSAEWEPVKVHAMKDSVYYQAPSTATTGSSHHASKKSASFPSKHPMQILAALASLGVTIPKDAAQAKDLLVELGRRRESIAEARDQALVGVQAKQQDVQKEIDAVKEKLAALTLARPRRGSAHRGDDSDSDVAEH